MNSFTKFLIRVFFIIISLVIAVPAGASTLWDNGHTPANDADPEKATIALQLPLDKKNTLTFYITPTETGVLEDYLDTTSINKFLIGLLTAIRNSKDQVRYAARDVIQRLFETDPSLANTQTLKLIEKSFLQGDADQWFSQGVTMLSSFIKVNHDLAPAVVKLIFKIIEKQIIVQRPISGSQSELILIMFYLHAVEINPSCVSVMLKIAEGDIQVPQEDRNEYFRFLILNMLSFVSTTNAVKENEQYIEAIFRIVFKSYPDKSTLVNNEIISLLNNIEKVDPAYSKDIFESLVRLAKKEVKTNDFNGLIDTVKGLSLLVCVNAAYAPRGYR